MKQINTYINEKLRLTKTQKYTCQPKDKKELQQIIVQRIKDEGPQCDLNDIDTSKIKDMSCLLYAYDNDIFKNFNGNISLWDVSNVTNMYSMFSLCKEFNCDLSMWNVSNVTNMTYMFYRCEKFNQNLNGWDASNVEKMAYAFDGCPSQPIWYDKDKRI